MSTQAISRRRIVSLLFILLCVSCSFALDTESLIRPCQIDAECDDGYFCSTGACLPGDRLDQELPDPEQIDAGIIWTDAGIMSDAGN